jgi:TfoX/Sxy family transcriptional regulator of competence genes
MATDRKTVDYLLDQIAGAGPVSAKAMFGEYGVYCDGKMVAIVADDRLFIKPTPAGRALADGAQEAAPYPGAKPCLLIDADRWDDADWLSQLVRVSADALPAPKPKAAKGRTPKT